MSDRHICRAKRIDNGEWVEGFLLLFKDEAFICNMPYKCMNGHSSVAGNTYGFGGFFQVEVSTVCQYTGLHDKNGKKIFERDIIRYIDEIIGKKKIDEVKYNETYALFCRLHKSVMGLQHFFIDEAVANRCEAIGNIFDNPELLEGGAE